MSEKIWNKKKGAKILHEFSGNALSFNFKTYLFFFHYNQFFKISNESLWLYAYDDIDVFWIVGIKGLKYVIFDSYLLLGKVNETPLRHTLILSHWLLCLTLFSGAWNWIIAEVAVPQA